MSTALSEQEINGHLKALPTLSRVALEILQSIDNDLIDTATLTQKIANDIGIASRVMRVANSPFFGSSGQISSLKEATLLLGFNSLRGLVTSAAVIQAFPANLAGFNVKAFWEHGLKIAVCAKLLAQVSHLDAETAFTAGLLHDIGLLTMALIAPEKLQSLNADDGIDNVLAHEAQVFGMHHGQMGGLVTAYWHLPAQICQAIEKHHDQTSVVEGQAPDISDILYVASLYAEYSDTDTTYSPYQKEFIEQAEKRLGLSETELQQLVQEIERLFDAAKLMIRE